MAFSAGWMHTLFLGAGAVAWGMSFMDCAVEFRVKIIFLASFTIFLCCCFCRLSVCFSNNTPRSTRQNSKLIQSEDCYCIHYLDKLYITSDQDQGETTDASKKEGNKNMA